MNQWNTAEEYLLKANSLCLYVISKAVSDSSIKSSRITVSYSIQRSIRSSLIQSLDVEIIGIEMFSVVSHMLHAVTLWKLFPNNWLRLFRFGYLFAHDHLSSY